MKRDRRSARNLLRWILGQPERDRRTRPKNRPRLEALESRRLLNADNGPHPNDPTYDLNSFEISANLSIYVDSQQVTIPASSGDPSTGEADIHVHDNSGAVHIHPQTPLTDFVQLGDFFDSWDANPAPGSPSTIELSNTQLFGNFVDSSNRLQMFVNGIEVEGEFAEYQIHDNDNIVLVYGSNPVVSFDTNAGSIPLELLADEAPIAVDNFLDYVNGGADGRGYDGTILHRSVPDLAILGGGFRPTSLTTTELLNIRGPLRFGPNNFSRFIPELDGITSERGPGDRSNTYGTLSGVASRNGLTSGFLFNTADNAHLDDRGFTVFAVALGTATPDGQPVANSTLNEIVGFTTVDVDRSNDNGGDTLFPDFDEVPYTPAGELVAIQAVSGNGTVRGQVFADQNQDGVLNNGEAGLAGRTIYSDTNDNGVLDADEASVVTDSNGAYALYLEPGPHTIRQQTVPWENQTTPVGPETFTLDVEIGREISDIVFGNFEVSSPTPTALDDVFIDLARDSADNLLNVLLNDQFIGNAGETLRITAVSQPNQGGTVTISSGDDNLIYTPAANFSGTETFTYTVTDRSGVIGSTSQATVTVTVDAVDDPTTNDRPTPIADTFTVRQNTSNTTLDVLANDSDLQGDTLTVAAIDTSGARGTVTIPTNRMSLLYTPPANFSGTDTFTYTLSDGTNEAAPVTVTVNVVDESTNGSNGSLAGLVYLDANDNNVRESVEGGIPGVVITLTGTTDLGAAVEQSRLTDADGAYSFDGLEPGTYQVSKRQSTALVDGQDSYNGTSSTHSVMDNLVLAGGQQLAGINFGETGLQLEYISIAWFFASSESNIEMLRETLAIAEENTGDSDLAESIRAGRGDVPTDVNDAPLASNDNFELQQGGTLTVTAASGVLVNDTDADNDSLTATVVGQPRNGNLTLNPDGSFTYIPNASFSGTDSFSYTASDGRLTSNIATVTVTVTEIDDPDPPNTPFGPVTPGSFEDAGVLGIRTDLQPGAPSLTADHVSTPVDYTGYSNPPTYGPHHAFLRDGQGNVVTPRPTGVYQTEQPDEDLLHNLEHGHVWISYNPTRLSSEDISKLEQFVIDGGTDTGVILTPRVANDTAIAAASWARLQTFDSYDPVALRNFVEANRGKSPEGFIPGGQKAGNSASENLDDGLDHGMAPPNPNIAPNANDDSFMTDRGSTLSISVAQGVLANDTDPESDSLAASVVSNPGNGTLSLSSDGTFTYSPNAGFTGVDSFTYRASDGVLSSNVATVSITVSDPGGTTNSAPTAASDVYSVAAGQTLSVGAADGVLNNDSDPENDNLSATVAQNVNNGQLTLNADGSFSYSPNAGFTGTDTFTYSASDGSLTSNGIVQISVNPENNTESFSVSALPSQDATLVENPTGAVANGAGPGIFVGTTNRNANAIRRGLIAFDLIDAGVPQGATITNVELTLNMSRTLFGDSDVALHRVSTAWSEGPSDGGGFGVQAETDDATWIHTAFPSSNWSNPGGDFVASASATTAVGGVGSYSWTSSQLIADVQSWIDNPSNNFGWILLGDETQPSSKRFDSREAPNAGDRPSLSVTYTVAANDTNTAPTANNDSFSSGAGSTLDVPVTQGLLANDSDPENDNLTATVVSNPSGGRLELSLDGSFSFTPNSGFTGTDSFTYRVHDGKLFSSTATVSITIDSTNAAPSATNDTYSVNEGQTLTVNSATGVLSNDSDADNDSLTATVVSQPSNGTLTLSSEGSFTYVPNANFSGSDTFTYRANDGDLSSNVATVSITVDATNSAPSGSSDNYSVDEGRTLVVNAATGVLTNDSDPENDSLTAALVSNPSSGTLTLNADGSFTYAPTADFTGNDSFTYRASDGSLTSDITTVSITVNSTNSAPSSLNDSYSTGTDQTLTVSATNGVLANDSDPENDSLTATVVSNPLGGTLTLNADGSFTYAPNANFTGADRFTYRAGDGSLSSNPSTVTVTVGQAQTATLTPFKDTTLYEDPNGGNANGSGQYFFAGRTAEPGNSLRRGLVAFDAASNIPAGATITDVTLQLFMSRTIVQPYDVSLHRVTSDWNEGSTDQTGEEGGAHVTAPAPGDATWIHSEFPSAFWNTPGGDFDPTRLATTSVGDTREYFYWNSAELAASVQDWVDNPSQNFGWMLIGDETVISAKRFDSSESPDPATRPTLLVTYIMPAAGNNAPVARNDSYEVDEGNTLSVSAPQGVLANDTDPENDNLTATVVSNPSSGTLTLSSDGSFTYAPNAGFTGTDTFTYRANDNQSFGEATVTITVNAANSPPSAADDVYSTDEDQTLTIDASGGVLANDTDPENDNLTATVVSNPSSGTLTLNSDGSFTYAPNADFSGTDTFTYTAGDGQLSSGVATATITVNAVNSPPSAADDVYSTDEDQTLTIDAAGGVLANDTDPENDNLTATVVSNPSSGTLTLNADGSFTYAPNTGFSGTDTFTYTAGDGQLSSSVATVSISVSSVNSAPSASDDVYSTNEGQTLTIDVAGGVLANDTDPDNDNLTATVVANPSSGTVTLGSDGAFTYVPNAGFSGTDTFTYTAGDGQLSSPTATVTVTVVAAQVETATLSANKDATLYERADGSVANGAGQYFFAGKTLESSNTLRRGLIAFDVAAGIPSGATITDVTLELNMSRTIVDEFDVNLHRVTTQWNQGTSDQIGEEGGLNPVPPTAGDATWIHSEFDTALWNTPGGDFEATPAATTPVNRRGTYQWNSQQMVANVQDWLDNPSQNFGWAVLTDEVNVSAKRFDSSENPNADNQPRLIVTYTVPAGTGNTAPVAADDSYSVDEDETLNISASAGVLANDSDADNDPLTVTVVDDVDNGQLTLNSDGSLTYTPNPDYNGADSFTYTASDGQSSAVGTVVITVNPVDEPQASSVTIVSRQDTTLIESTDGERGNGAGTGFFVGRTNGNGGGLPVRRGLVEFDLAGASIPAGATITNVELTLNMSQTTTGEADVALHRVTSDWGEGASSGGGSGAQAQTNDATWLHTFYAGATWNTPGGDFESSASASTPVDGVGSYSWSSPQLVADVQSWLADPSSNFGWIMIGDETAPSTKRFDSREHANADNRPQLKIDFEV
ncbi:Ig-like domain-containing protein [Planctomycetes bacterium TBK1r]|uniref:Peptidyl-prolyl cis-trans isomerase A n=1 Tax=Stieleria magnilauensis TaxID=2527963 RepID=A0ABX5XRY7_9BACT|nr:Peptidyl-prolyl cis-trans isomerase A precursor [Planctomycetes bacterium TBK1r]